MDIRVCNCRAARPDVYCGRAWAGYPASPLANPCSKRGATCPVCGQTHTGRGSSIPCYRKWLWSSIRAGDKAVLDALEAIRRLATDNESVTLGCWCVDDQDPSSTETEVCHAQVIAKAVAWLQRKGAA